MHYNVQSLLHKLDIIAPELSNFDLVTLTETWLNERVLTQDLAFNNYRLPFRRDRSGDSHGGIGLNFISLYKYTIAKLQALK